MYAIRSYYGSRLPVEVDRNQGRQELTAKRLDVVAGCGGLTARQTLQAPVAAQVVKLDITVQLAIPLEPLERNLV